MNFKMKNSIINASALHLMVALFVFCTLETRAQEKEDEYISI